MQWDNDTSCFGDYSVDPRPAIRDLADQGVELRVMERQIVELEQRARRSSKQHAELEELRAEVVLLRSRIETNRRALQLHEQLRQPTTTPACLGQPGYF